MDADQTNAEWLLRLTERLRPHRPGPAFTRLHALDLSLSHLRVLRTLYAAHRLPMKALADQLCIKPPSLTALTRRLVETGLVKRHIHAADSRVVLLELTETGRSLHCELHEEQLQRMQQLLARLRPDEQRTLLDLLERATTPPLDNNAT
jgi:DNA-binding MarR family transcriptional regulator